MFKAANPYDELVTKATDENLTSENWELNLDVCDKISGQGEAGARECIAAISKRLLHRSANVQLYALTLADSLSKNVSSTIIYPELSSRSFCQTIVRVAMDRTTHEMVKKKVASVLKEWNTKMNVDQKDGEMKGELIKETVEDLKRQNFDFGEPQEEAAPAEPSSEQLRREDEELRRALEISLQDQGGRNAYNSAGGGGAFTGAGGSSVSGGGVGSGAAGLAGRGAGQGVRLTDSGPTAPNGSSHAAGAAARGASESNYAPQAQQATVAQQPQQQQPAAAAGGGGLAASRVRALYDFQPTEQGELAFSKGDVIRVLDSVYEHWWRGEVKGDVGIFPVNYVEILPDPTPEDIQRDAELEARIFSSASSIDQLIMKLSSLDPRKKNLADDEELQELYQQALSIRPKIVRLIDRYSAKVAELKGLNEKFVKARGRFEGLMEESLQRWEPNRAGQAGREYMGYRHPQNLDAQQQQQQPALSPGLVAGPGGVSPGLAPGQGQIAPAQAAGQQEDPNSSAWAQYYAQQQQQPPPQQQQQAYPQQQQQQQPEAAAVPQPPPGLHPSDPAYAQWYYAHFPNPNDPAQQQQQQPPPQQQQYAPQQVAGASSSSLADPSAYGSAAGASGSSTNLAAGSSSAYPGGSGSSSSGAYGGAGGSSAAAGGSSSSGGGPPTAPPQMQMHLASGEVPQDDEKRRLFERARAEAEAYQEAHKAYLARTQGQLNGQAIPQ